KRRSNWASSTRNNRIGVAHKYARGAAGGRAGAVCYGYGNAVGIVIEILVRLGESEHSCCKRNNGVNGTVAPIDGDHMGVSGVRIREAADQGHAGVFADRAG